MPENMARGCRVLRSLGRNSRASAEETDGACAKEIRETRGKKRKDPASRSLAVFQLKLDYLLAVILNFVQKTGFYRITTYV